jgi:three-Cys-motif partner protein
MGDEGGGRPRQWTWTTTVKLEVLEQYLKQFTTTAKYKAGGNTVYLDLFAGGLENIDKFTGQPFPGSAELALHTEPAFRTVRLFEMPPNAAQLRAELTARFPGRDLQVIEGDCNTTLPEALASLNRHAPTFAFVDPDGLEVRWSTLEALADHKRSGRSPYKVELWILFSAPGLLRTLALDERKLTPSDEDRANRLFGTGQWRCIYEARVRERITPASARQEYVNLMRWRLQEVLGYRYTHALEMKLPEGQPLYNMVFASDNDAGNDIMSALYRKAYARWPQMRAEREAARRRREHGPNLFEAAGLDDPTLEPTIKAAYEHLEPWTPPETFEDLA